MSLNFIVNSNKNNHLTFSSISSLGMTWEYPVTVRFRYNTVNYNSVSYKGDNCKNIYVYIIRIRVSDTDTKRKRKRERRVGLGVGLGLGGGAHFELTKVRVGMGVEGSLRTYKTVTHICYYVIIVSGNGLSPAQRRAVTWTNANLL